MIHKCRNWYSGYFDQNSKNHQIQRLRRLDLIQDSRIRRKAQFRSHGARSHIRHFHARMLRQDANKRHTQLDRLRLLLSHRDIHKKEIVDHR